jgi:hypothetical protein
MAKAKKPTPAAPKTLAELAADPANPRRISDRAAGKLKGSLSEFGDLSGIVFNRRTCELVAGHQRVAQIRKLWPDAEMVQASPELGVIVVDAERCFRVRIVDWPRSRQRAANVTANNGKIQGEFTPDVRSYLLDVHEALDAELPAIAERVRLLEWLDPIEDDFADQPVTSLYQVIATCDGEENQEQLRDELAKRGFRATSVVG